MRSFTSKQHAYVRQKLLHFLLYRSSSMRFDETLFPTSPSPPPPQQLDDDELDSRKTRLESEKKFSFCCFISVFTFTRFGLPRESEAINFYLKSVIWLSHISPRFAVYVATGQTSALACVVWTAHWIGARCCCEFSFVAVATSSLFFFS